MSCTVCGPYPDTVVWDGVVLAFGKKKLLESIRPPTISSDDAQQRLLIKYQPKQQLIKDRKLRKRIQTMLHGPPKPRRVEKSRASDDDTDTEESDDPDQLEPPSTNYLTLVDSVLTDLRDICEALSDLVDHFYGQDAFRERRTVPAEYKNFLCQVCCSTSPFIHTLKHSTRWRLKSPSFK